MKKTHVPCSLKIEEEAVRYDLDNPTKRNTAKLLQLFLTALGYFGSVLVICDLYGTFEKESFCRWRSAVSCWLPCSSFCRSTAES